MSIARFGLRTDKYAGIASACMNTAAKISGTITPVKEEQAALIPR
jgi:hypothetical protein